MTVAKVWDPNTATWVPLQGGVVSQAAFDNVDNRVTDLERGPHFTEYGRISGSSVGYVPLVNGQILFCDAAKLVPLRLTIIPTVEVFWEILLFVGTLQKTDANYHYCQSQCGINVADLDGNQTATATKTQHSGVQQFEPHMLRRTYRLAGGAVYSTVCTLGVSGGTWQYNQASNMLYLEGKVYEA